VDLQQSDHAADKCKKGIDLLVGRTQYDYAVVLRRWVCADVPESAVEGQKSAAFGPADGGNARVCGTAQPFINSSGRVVASRA